MKKGSKKFGRCFWMPAGDKFLKKIDTFRSDCPRCGTICKTNRYLAIKYDNVTGKYIDIPDIFEYCCPKCGIVYL